MVHRLGHELDWARLSRTADSDGRSRFVYVALRLAGVLLETPVPEGVIASLGDGVPLTVEGGGSGGLLVSLPFSFRQPVHGRRGGP